MSHTTAGLLGQASSTNCPSKLAGIVFTASINPTYTYGKVTEDSGASDASSGDFIHPAQRILRVGTFTPLCFAVLPVVTILSNSQLCTSSCSPYWPKIVRSTAHSFFAPLHTPQLLRQHPVSSHVCCSTYGAERQSTVTVHCMTLNCINKSSLAAELWQQQHAQPNRTHASVSSGMSMGSLEIEITLHKCCAQCAARSCSSYC